REWSGWACVSPCVRVYAVDAWRVANSSLERGNLMGRAGVLLGMRRMPAAVAGAAVLLLAAACSSSHASPPHRRVPSTTRPGTSPSATSRADPEAAKALAAGTAFLTWHGDSSRGLALELRSVGDGHLLRTLLPADPTKGEAAIVEPDGSLLLASGGRCNTTLTRLDLTTGRQQTVGKLAESASDIVVNPAGTKIAYVTYPTCEVNP